MTHDASIYLLLSGLSVVVPTFWVTLAFTIVSAVSAWWTQRRGWDAMTGTGLEVSVILSSLALMAAVLLNQMTWGVWWTGLPFPNAHLYLVFSLGLLTFFYHQTGERLIRTRSLAIMLPTVLIVANLIWFSSTFSCIGMHSLDPVVLASGPYQQVVRYVFAGNLLFSIGIVWWRYRVNFRKVRLDG